MKDDQTKAPIPMKIVIALVFAAMVLVNFMAQSSLINGVSTGDLSDSYPNLFVPIGFTFSVWGIIYILLLGYVLFQLGLFRKTETMADVLLVTKTRYAFLLSSIVNIGWIFAWHFRLVALSVVLMLVLLASLAYMNSVLNRAVRKGALTFREKVFLRLPFSAYFGWITVATIANVSAFLVSIKWDRFGGTESTWMIFMLGIGTIIATADIILGRDAAYGLVVIWAYVGILIKHILPQGFNLLYPEIVTVTSVCTGVLVLAVLYALLFRRLAAKKNRDASEERTA